MGNITSPPTTMLKDSGEWNSFQREESQQSIALTVHFARKRSDVKGDVTSLVLLAGLVYEDWGQGRLGKRYADDF